MIPDLDRDYGTVSKFAKQVPFELARLLLDPGEGSQHLSLGIEDRGAL